MSCDVAALPYQAHANYETLMNNSDKLMTGNKKGGNASTLYLTLNSLNS